MYTASFEYQRASSVNEAIAMLKANPDAKLLAGGHSLIPAMKLRAAQPPALIDISRIPSLSSISVSGGTVKIGALATHNAVATSKDVQKHCGLLAETAAHIGDQQVRNRGTLGGALAHADPAADYPTAILALEATITAQGSGGSRDIAASAFFKDLFTTSLKGDEIITGVSVPAYGKGTGGAYLKHAHPASGYAVVGVAAIVMVANGKVTAARVAVGGVTVNPVRASAAEAALVGQAPTAENIAAAAAKVGQALTSPLSDAYASGEYRQHLATVLAKRALLKAAERAGA
ncbi:MAG: FAD binding domain-containing protein [Anaerolineales bacterium]